jgi:two-component system cell cycle response regulator
LRRKPVIFLISRDRETASVAEGLAASSDWTLVEAESAQRAIAQAKTSEPHLIVLDETLDGGDWKEIYRALCGEISYTFMPILVLVDEARVEDAVESLETGLVDILVKPVTQIPLKTRLKAMIQIKEMHDSLDEERALLRQKLDEERKLREKLAVLNEELKKLSTTDGLTGLANQRYLQDWLKTEFEVVSRYDMPLAAIMMDLDEFKQVNDEHGHIFGDFVLKGVAEVIREQSRRADLAARYGGEEFVVVLPNTDGYAAANLANRIHKALREHVFRDGSHETTITASFGISAYPADGVSSAKDLIELADRALSAAKEQGRDRVVSWTELDK